MKIDVRPNRDRVFVELVKESEKVPGSNLVVPDIAKKPRRGIVLAVGPGLLTANGIIVPSAYAPGDVVLFSRYAGTEIVVLDQETGHQEHVLCLRDDEILGATTLEPEEAEEPFEVVRARMLADGQAPTASEPLTADEALEGERARIKESFDKAYPGPEVQAIDMEGGTRPRALFTPPVAQDAHIEPEPAEVGIKAPGVHVAPSPSMWSRSVLVNCPRCGADLEDGACPLPACGFPGSPRAAS